MNDTLLYSPANENEILLSKESLQKLEEALDERNKLLSNMEEAYFSVDLIKGKILILSDANEDIYGYSLEEIYENPNFWFDAIHPDYKKIIEESMHSLKQGKSVINEYRIKRKNGKIIWVEGKLIPTLDKSGILRSLDGTVMNISKKKKAERIRDEKVNDLKTFMYKTTHDLKSPLSTMAGLIKLVEKEIKTGQIQSYFEMIQTCVNRMELMLNDLTNIIEISDNIIKAELIDFGQMIEGIKSNTRLLPDWNKINFSVEIELKQDFHTDKRLLTGILQNLIDNAVKYRMTMEKSYIQIKIKRDNIGVIMEVTDNGIGIPSYLQKKIFDIFFRASELSKGTGLGLYIVKNSVQKLFGKIKLISEEKRGSTFIVYLPDILQYRSKNKKENQLPDKKQLSLSFAYKDKYPLNKNNSYSNFPNLFYICQPHDSKMTNKPYNSSLNALSFKNTLLPPPPRFYA